MTLRLYTKQRLKFGNKSCVYNGRRYDSKKEAGYAEKLDWMKKAGEIKDWEPQVTYQLYVNGLKIAGIRPDFKIYNHDGSVEIHEIKSSATATPLWSAKWNLLRALIHELEPDCIDMKVIY